MLLGALSVGAQEKPVTAADYKQKVLEYSRQIKQSAEERIAMQHAIKAAKTAFFPALDFSGSYQYRINKYDLDFGPGMSVEMDHNTYSLGATVSQPVYAGGQIYNNYKAAQIQGQIASEAEDLTTDNIVYAADLNYWSAAARKGMYDVMCQYVDIVQELANVLTTRFNDGQISKTDLLQGTVAFERSGIEQKRCVQRLSDCLAKPERADGSSSYDTGRDCRCHHDGSAVAHAHRGRGRFAEPAGFHDL